MDVVLQPFGKQTLGDYLRSALKGEIGAFQSFEAAVAFVKRSGVQCIADELRDFVNKGWRLRMTVGVDLYGTSIEGLSDLLVALNGQGEVWICHDEGSYVTFHVPGQAAVRYRHVSLHC